MTKINNKLNKRPIKRLQTGPKKADPNTTQLDTGLAIVKLMGRLMDEHLEISMSKAKAKYLALENKKAGKKMSSQEEECLSMLETLKVTEGREANVPMDEPGDKAANKDTQEDNSKDSLLDDQWEDFSSPEEEEEMAKQVAEAELALMRKF